MPTDFTPIASFAGGVLIGLSAVLLMALQGRIAGVSGIAAGLLPPWSGPAGWRIAFLAGLVGAAAVAGWVLRIEITQTVTTDGSTLVVGGLLVGVGTVLGSGCTSGHGVCGLARFSVRSLAAVATFMATAGLTVFAVRHLAG